MLQDKRLKVKGETIISRQMAEHNTIKKKILFFKTANYLLNLSP